MYEPTRGGTRGGQAEFKWTDVSADKDREHYLGHSINAPTGRWQKNKDVHWYNRDKNQSDEAKALELAKIKEAEREAMSIALGFKPSKPVGDGTTSGANAIPVGDAARSVPAVSGPAAEGSTHPVAAEVAASSPSNKGDDDHSQLGTAAAGEEKKESKEGKRARKAEKKVAKEERRREKQEERERRAMDLVARQKQRQRSASPPRRGDHHHHRRAREDGQHRHHQHHRPPPREDSERKRDTRRSLTPLKDLPWMAKDRDLSPPLPRTGSDREHAGGRDSRDDPRDRPSSRRDYDGREMEKERANDRRRWEENRARQESARRDWDRP